MSRSTETIDVGSTTGRPPSADEAPFTGSGRLIRPGRRRVFVPGLTDVVALDSYGWHVPSYCARRRTGEVLCWEGPSTVGVGECEEFRLPSLDWGCGPGSLRRAAEYGFEPRIMHHGCVVRADRSGWCQGDGGTLQGLEDVVELAGDRHSGCARTGRGEVWCWGPRDPKDTYRPAMVPGITDAVELGVGTKLRCARTRGGTVACWGPGEAPSLIPELADATDLDLGERLCVVRRSGAVYCTVSQIPPLGVTPIHGIADAVEVEVFDAAVCARTRSGGVCCAGPAYAGTTYNAIPIVGAANVVRIVAVDPLLCGITATGEHLCWAPGPAPEVVRPPELAGVRDLAGECVVEADGRVSCWVPRSGIMVIFD